MSRTTRRVLFAVFFLSGACGLIYQIVWTRMAFAAFGIITPVLSVVVSIFMLGLALGAWLGGRSVDWFRSRTGLSPILFYAATESLIGLGAFAVPWFFGVGQQLLWSAGEMNSARYLISSAVVLALSILPPCLCMGATFPFVMAFVREQDERARTSFSFLYTANVLGAMFGTLLAALALIELLGFHGTLVTAAIVNFLIAGMSAALFLARRGDVVARPIPAGAAAEITSPAPSPGHRRLIKWVLFATGFCAMAMEVVWVRAFTPVIHTQVYSFAMILFSYLTATFIGSTLYRRALRRKRVRSLGELLALCAAVTFLPIVLNDMRLLWSNRIIADVIVSSAIVLLSICPLCAALGYLTPSLIDEDGRGEPAEAGRAYAVNVLGCIIGPLFASYVLLPWCGEHYALILLGLPFVAFYLWQARRIAPWLRVTAGIVALALLGWSIFGRKDFAGYIVSRTPRMEIRRDYAASVIAAGEKRDKFLIVNGIGMTGLVPPTKFMIHLPMLLHAGPADSALIICFGMGTTFRSSLSWGVETTAVELVPSVTKSFEFYHADAAAVRSNPKGHIVIDDGRRYLSRTQQKFDVIVIDPPPPMEAAGSSLLYSEEFYALAKRHLKPNGILQTWMPGFDVPDWQAIGRSLQRSFPHVKSFIGFGQVGTHFLASMEPIGDFSAQQLALTMPTAAADDLLEWSGGSELAPYLNEVLDRRIIFEETLNPDPRVRITDDRPFNEYFLLRNAGWVRAGRH